MAYHPWRQIFRALLSVTADANESSALTQQLEDTLAKIYPEGLPRLPLLGDLFNIHIQDNNLTSNFDSKMRQDALFALAVDILRSKAATQSLLLLIDDIHKLDGASQELALFIAKNLEDTPILFLLAQRPEEILPELDNLSYYHALALSSLPDDDIDKLIVNRLKDRVSPLAQKLLHLRAQGNPFFVEALIDELRESKRLIKRSDNIWRLSRPVVEMLRQANCLINVDDEWELSPDASWETVDLGIPVALDSLILSRVDRLPDAHRLTLKAAAVLGNSFEAPLLSHLRDLPPSMIAECLAQIAVRGLIRPESSAPQPVYRFRHNIIQETIYNSLSDSQRKMLHRRAGEALEERAPFGVERLAYHFRLSNVNNPAIRSKAMSYLEKAAEKTRREYANEAALHYYNHALALEERWQWLKSKAEILHLTGDRDAEYQTLQKLQHKEDVPDFDITYLWGDYYEATSKSDEAEKHYEAALKIARAQDNTVDALRALIQVGFVMTKRANYEDALVKYQETILFCQMLPPSGQSEEIEKMQAQIFNGAGTAHLRLGHYDQAAMYYQKGLDISRKWGVQWQEARALEGLGNATTYRQQFLEGRKYLKQALLIWKKIGDISRESSTLYNLGINFQEAGEYERALTTFENALSIHQKIKNLYEQINVLNSLGSLYLRFGLLSEALNHLEQGLKIAAESNDSEGRAFLLSTLGMVVKYQREFKRAEEYLREGLDFAKIENNEGQMAVFLSYLGMVSLESGNLRQSINYAQQALDIRGSLEGSMRIANDLKKCSRQSRHCGGGKETLSANNLMRSSCQNSNGNRNINVSVSCRKRLRR
ncbi:MAG: hypothetical protein B6I38_00555 [Anaerolineaceae bacterium 4572_5.1]|nr:MAG: hypothetical protein B6I38_00555 [Anaerolineaceae bacterium 4572_5.1]